MKRSWLIVLTLVGALLNCGRAMAQCADMNDDPLSYDPYAEHRAMIAKKIEYALTVISDEQQLQKDPDCVSKAISFLGTFRVEKAMPRMLALLTFERKVDRPISRMTRSQQYPAIAGLAGIGKPAVPSLLKVITDSQIELERDNAAWALTSIYVGHPKQLLDLLQKAADVEQDSAKALHLRDARAEVQSMECHDTNRCEVDSGSM